jgi:hypothetical protein
LVNSFCLPCSLVNTTFLLAIVTLLAWLAVVGERLATYDSG